VTGSYFQVMNEDGSNELKEMEYLTSEQRYDILKKQGKATLIGYVNMLCATIVSSEKELAEMSEDLGVFMKETDNAVQSKGDPD